MSYNLELGAKGEAIAVSYLQQKKYRIIETNWRCGRYEVDIIAQLAETLVFIEVKTRSNHKYGYPEDSVGKKKQEFLANAAEEYIHQINHNDQIRFDIISITKSVNKDEILHIEDAFFPFNDV